MGYVLDGRATLNVRDGLRDPSPPVTVSPSPPRTVHSVRNVGRRADDALHLRRRERPADRFAAP